MVQTIHLKDVAAAVDIPLGEVGQFALAFRQDRGGLVIKKSHGIGARLPGVLGVCLQILQVGEDSF